MKKITTIYRFRILLFLTPHQTANLGTLRPGSLFCGPRQSVYDGEKMFRKIAAVSEKIWIKEFSMGQFPPQRGQVVEKFRHRPIIMGARVLYVPVYGSLMPIFRNNLQNVQRFCAVTSIASKLA